VAATVRLARALGVDTVAEGVETEDQLVLLRMLGCDYGQGFHWAHPMPPSELERWWSEWSPRSVQGASAGELPEDDASASLDDVLAYLVHELRSPLTVIAGYADLAQRANDPNTPAYLEAISRAAQDLDRRISSLADARDAGRGAMRLVLEDVNVGELTRALVGDLTPQLAPHPITLQVDQEMTARADRSRLAQAITNLLVNAAKFSQPGAPIEVAISSAGAQGLVSVRDHGPGVPEDRRSELFRRFSRLGSHQVGMGVGLHLVRTIATAHGGDVRYEPAPGGGSRFAISIPVTPTGPRAHAG